MADEMYMDIGNGAVHRQQMSTSGLDALAESSQRLQNGQVRSLHHAPQLRSKHRHGTTNGSGGNMMPVQQDHSTSDTRGSDNAHEQSVRRRISRACDQCNQLRTKCDGVAPCAHCVEFGLTCEYARARKKRGKISRKDIVARQAAGATGSAMSASPTSMDEGSPEDAASSTHQGMKRRRSTDGDLPPRQVPQLASSSITSQPYHHGHNASLPSREQAAGVTSNPPHDRGGQDQHWRQGPNVEAQVAGYSLPTPRLSSTGPSDRAISVGMGDYGTIDDYHRSILHPASTVAGHSILHSNTPALSNSVMQGGPYTGYGEPPYAVPSPNSQNSMAGVPFRMGESPLSTGFLGQSPVIGSPGWLLLPPPSAALNPSPSQVLRYPVLRPLLPHISAIIPIGLACDLLDVYFSSVSSVFQQPSSPYVLGYAFRKRSFLRQQNPRVCSPALLASMLWVGVQTSESAFLTSPPSARGKIGHKLFELTCGLLKPLTHGAGETSGNQGSHVDVDGVTLSDFRAASSESEPCAPRASLDDVASYINLATVVSASEYKAVSLRWWSAAWSLARELKLGRELPPNAGTAGEAGANGKHVNNSGGRDASGTSEEVREERRRLWWLLYIADRHLALCYNKPLFLLDVQCEGLLQPEDEFIWQSGEFYPLANHAENLPYRRRGPVFDCSGCSIFSQFLPLMSILGGIVDLKHAQDHPKFGLRFRSPDDWNVQASMINHQLEEYGRSLKNFEARHYPPVANELPPDADGRHQGLDKSTPPEHSTGINSSIHRTPEALLRTKIAVAYGTHLMHTFHILLNGKWDPISLLDDNDLWISSSSFISATGHAVEAAAAIDDILEYDPDLSFMPFFFGIYLLQGSFLLLLIADKLQGDASPSVVKACETIVRAHEACVVTLNTEYQVNFPRPLSIDAFTDSLYRETSARSCALPSRRSAAARWRIWAISSYDGGRCWRCTDGRVMGRVWLCNVDK